MKLPKLNLPENKFRFKKSPKGDAMIFDSIRTKWLVLTPEEWVRQNLVITLINHWSYPKGLLKLETGVNINGNPLRSDVVFYKNNQPHILIECKAPKIKLSEKVLDQALNYNTKYNCEFIILSNGLEHVSIQIESESIKKLTDFPQY